MNPSRLTIFCIALLSLASTAQTNFNSSTPASVYPGALLQFDADSLKGFNSAAVEANLHNQGLFGKEFYMHMARLKRDFIKAKYALSSGHTVISGAKMGGSSQVNVAPCVNEGFESTAPGTYNSANAVSGWTLTSHDYSTCISSSTGWTNGSNQFAIVATPISNFPNIGTIPHSPLGGTVVAQLNNTSPDYKCTRIAQTFPVTNSNSLFTYAFAGYFDDGGSAHGCCEQPGFRVVIKDCQGNVNACQSETLALGCSNSISTFTLVNNALVYTNWQVRAIDLTPFIGTCVTIEAMANDCAYGGHTGVAFFDAVCSSALSQVSCNCSTVSAYSPIGFCPGSSAVLQAPNGYSLYTWGNSSGTLTSPSPVNSYTITNPTPGAVYSASFTTSAGCIYIQNFTLATTQVSVNAIGATASCSLGASGSATVIGTGSGSGYNYIWTNSTNSVVSTSSVVNNLVPGVYSVQVSATSSCGIAGATVNVTNTMTNVYHLVKPYCGNTAYFHTAGGSGFQWYANNSPISGSTGTAPSLTVTTPVNGMIYRLRYFSPQGCRDSIIYTLQPSNTPTVSVVPAQICPGASNGNAQIVMITATNQVTGMNIYSVSSTGTTSPYSSTLNLSSSNSYTASSLSQGTYSVLVFDGSCYGSAAFSVSPYIFNYSVSPSSSVSICQGASTLATVILSNSMSPSGFTYSWTPNQNLLNNVNTSVNVFVTPTAVSGASSTIVYTVVVTPTAVNCPISRTLAVTVSNPLPASVITTGQFCANSPTITLTGMPSGGYFASTGQGTAALSSSGMLTPSLAAIGINNFTYVSMLNNCASSAPSAYTILPTPVLSISGATSVCSGQSATLTASGAVSYQWQGLGQQAAEVVSPVTTTGYTVAGTSGNGCTSEKTFVVYVTPLPALMVTGSESVCAGSTTTLTASGAQTYSWSNGNTAPTQTFAPINPVSYTLTGINNPGACKSNTVISLVVISLPPVSVTGPYTVCAGALVQLNALGGATYKWNGIQGSSTFSFYAIAATAFTVTGTDLFGCSAKAVHLIDVQDCTGLSEFSKNSTVKIYPNPTRGELHILLEETSLVTLHDAAGKLIFNNELGKGEHKIDLSEHSAGMYLLQTRSLQGNSVQRVIKKD